MLPAWHRGCPGGLTVVCAGRCTISSLSCSSLLPSTKSCHTVNLCCCQHIMFFILLSFVLSQFQDESQEILVENKWKNKSFKFFLVHLNRLSESYTYEKYIKIVVLKFKNETSSWVPLELPCQYQQSHLLGVHFFLCSEEFLYSFAQNLSPF